MAKQPAKDSALSTYQTWKARLDAAAKEFKPWEDRSDRIIKRYRDERTTIEDKRRRFNILWSNVQVLKPALYGRTAKPQVSRRFKDADPVGRLSSLILERCLEYETEQYAWFDAAMEASVEDRLLPGRGIAWVRYEPHIEQEAQVSDAEDSNVEKLTYECAPVDYVHWKDFSHSPARSWEEVWWVRRRVYMTRDEGIKRFGDKFKNVPLDKMEDGAKEVQAEDDRKAKVSEIWCKTNRTVYWIADDHQLMLDEKPDPLGLDDFFPCPKPLYATVTNGSLVPVPDYCQYQDQAEEIDTLTQRISLLTKALKVVGVHNAEFKGLNRILDEGGENRMIPVDSWAAFAEKGGMAGAIEFLPIKEIAEVIERLYLARDQAKQIIYETIGLADIMRGSSDASETLGAQQLKANFGGLRLKKPQKEVATYATALLRLMGEVMCKHFKPETLIMISGVEHMIDANDPEQAAQLEQALGLLQSDARNFRIEVDADSLAQIDEAQEKAEATEFVTSVGTMLREAAPIVQTMPALLPLVGSVIKFAVQRQRAGRTIEQEFEKALEQVGQAPQAQEPDPALQEREDAMQQEAERLKQEGQAQQVKGMELSYGETYAKEKIAMQQQLAAKDIEIQRMAAERELEKRLAAIAEQERALEMREMALSNKEQMAKQGQEVRAAVQKLQDRGDESNVVQLRERMESQQEESSEIADALQSLVEIARAPQRKSGKIKGPSGRTYEVDITQQSSAESE